jgi:S1-C subfamily serine protease
MVTANVIQRTFRIQYGQMSGTAFTVDVDGREYLITAKHVLPNIQANDYIHVSHNGTQHKLATRLVGACPDPIDILVLALDTFLAPDIPLRVSDENITFGQDVYFLGFPFGIGAEWGDLNRDFPLPLIKRATLSTITGKSPEPRVFYLDGNNNPGFSGGPVVFTPRGGVGTDQSVVAVIHGYLPQREPVYDGKTKTQYDVATNSGIIIAYGVWHALEVIRANPIGFDLSKV